MFGDRLQELRLDAELTQEQLSEKLHVSRQAISTYEKNSSEPNLSFVIRCSELFNVSTDYLLCKTKFRTPIERLFYLRKGNSKCTSKKLDEILLKFSENDKYIDIVYDFLILLKKFL